MFQVLFLKKGGQETYKKNKSLDEIAIFAKYNFKILDKMYIFFFIKSN